MAIAAKKPCSALACNELTSSGRFCTAHTTPKNLYSYDQRRGTPKERGYDAAWRKVRVDALRRDCFLCQQCLREDRLSNADHVDHIIPIPQRPDLRLILSNLQSLCIECHSRKTALEDGAFSRPTKKR